MKKKIFSALLMGVFTLASMSMFVSCKDYDDDINNLDAGQQELLSRLEALEGNVDQKLPEIESSLTTAVDNANKALQGVEEAKGLINEVKTTAEEAGKAAAGAQEDATAAKETAEEALQKAEDALKAIGVDESGVSLVEKVNDLAEQLGTLQEIANNIPTLIEEAQKATKEELAKINEKVSKYEDLFDSLFAMLTDVEFYGTFSGHQFNVSNLKKLNLKMLHGTVGENSTFGDNEAYIAASPLVNYVKGTDIKNPSGVIVRVNPVNADITGDNVSIKLINSLGQDMSAYVEAKAEPFEQLITRAGNTSKSGLYKVNFQFVDGVDMDAFDKMLTDPETKDSVLFAIAINNTDSLQDDRYVASTFDLTVASDPYESTTTLTYSVTGTNGKVGLAQLKNRWSALGAVDDNGQPLADATEYKWTTDSKIETPATAANTASNGNAVKEDATGEYRSVNGYLPVEVGVPFTVELDDQNGKIDHYYVVLDKNFAGESAPSEWNAWTSYTYTGLQTMTDADKKLDITINSESALGDHIGFRLYAVNRDGTLVDPDGKAFYVAVGNATTTTSVDVKVRAWVADDQKYVIAELPKTFKPVTCETPNSGVAQRKDFDKDGVKSSENASINWRLLKDKDDVDAVIDWKDAKYIKISLQKGVQDFLDDATFSFTIKGEVKTNTSGTVTRVVNTINVNVTKVMPTAEVTDFSFKENQLVNGVYTCYLDAESWATPKWNSTYSENTKGYKNIWNFVTGLDEDKVNDGLSKDFIFTFAKAQWNADDKDYTDSKVVKTRTAKEYILDLPQVLIDGKTEHATQIQRNYPDISYRPNKDGVLKAEANYIVDLLECNTIFACPISKTTYSWNQKLTGYTALGAPIYADVNWIEYDSQNGPATTVLAIVDEGGKVTGYENIVKYLAATNTVDPALYTTGKLWNVAFYASDASGNPIVSAKLISNGTQKEDYFLVTVNKDGTFKFTPVSGATNPTADVASTLVITAKDAFGHTYEYELPFTVKKRV